MADPKTQMLQVSLPGSGKTRTYQLTADTPVKFNFDIAEAVFTGNNGNLEIAVEGGGTVILENYQALADAGTLPTFMLMNGEVVAGDVYLFAFGSEEGMTAEELETAADAAASGSGAGEYSDDPGNLFAGLDALGPQGDAYDASAIEPLPELTEPFVAEEEEPIPPVAVDDVNTVTEAGERVEGPDYPDMNGDQGVATGNLLLNDYDGDNIDYPETGGVQTELEVHAIDFPGEDFTGNNPEAVLVTDAGVNVNGLYGVLTVYADGTYSYVLDQNLADPIMGEMDVEEVFNYTAIDPDGLVSNQATLTITINGTNDPPTITVDPAPPFVEELDASAQDLHAAGSVYFDDVDANDVIDIDASYDGNIVWSGGTLSPAQIAALTSGTFTASATDEDAPGSTGWDYTADDVDLDFMLDGETITFSYTVTATDSQGATDTDQVTITINGTADAPVAVHDGYHEISVDLVPLTGFDRFSGFNGNQHVEDNMYFVAESTRPTTDPDVDIQLRTGGGTGNLTLGVINDSDSGSDEQSVDSVGYEDSLFIQFIEPQKPQPDPEDVPLLREGQAQIDIHLLPDSDAGIPYTGASVDIWILDPSDTDPSDGQDIMYYKTVEFDTLDFSLTTSLNDGLEIYAIELKPSDPDTAFWLDGIFAAPPEYELNLGSAANNNGEVEGNVLYNDFDIEGDDMSVTDVDGTGVISAGTEIEGTYGLLTIDPDGSYTYDPYEVSDPATGKIAWSDLLVSQTEKFMYTVEDDTGQTDEAYLEFSINVNTNRVDGDGTSTPISPLEGSALDDVIFPADTDAILSGDGSDSIVIDPDYIGDTGAPGMTVDVLDFSDSDWLALGNMEGATVEITSTPTDLNLVFSDVDGSNDIVVNLMGVDPVNPVPTGPVEITTSEDLNTLIQSIIDSGNDGF